MSAWPSPPVALPPSVGYRPDDFRYRVAEDGDEDDGGSRRYLELVGQDEASQTAQVTDADGQPDDFLEAVGEQVGGHLRKGEQGDGQHDAYHAQAGHDGEGDEHHQYILEEGDRHPLRTGELTVEGDGHDGAQEQGEEDGQHHTQHGQEQDVGAGDGQDIPEQVRRQVGRESRGQEAEDDTDGHAEGPEHGDGRVLAHVAALAEPFYPEGGKHGEHRRAQQGGDTGIETDADAAERGMGNPSADEDQAAGHDVGPDDAARDAGKQAAQQGVLEKGIVQ